MKTIFYVVLFALLSSTPASAQTSPSWAWGTADTSIAISRNPDYLNATIATSATKTLWSTLQNMGITTGTILGNYKLTELDTNGNAGATKMIYGNLTLLDAQADAAGDWYLLGQYHDTVKFPGGTTLSRNAISGTEPEYFICKFANGSLNLSWVQLLGNNYESRATAFVVRNNGIYVAVDSSYSFVYRLDPATGAPTKVLTQAFSSITSSLAVDNSGNIYLAGSCAFNGLNFGGTTIRPSTSYPAYLVRYKANGTHDWNQIFHDVTCVPRKITLGGSNTLYYSGAIHDSFIIGPHLLHHPAWVYNYFVAMLDSSGTLRWITSLPDSTTGDAAVDFSDHFVVMNDRSINVLATIRGRINWTGGIITNTGFGSSTAVVHYDALGIVQSVKYITADYATCQHIKTDGESVYISGYGIDSTALTLDGLTTPLTLTGYSPYVAKLLERNSRAGLMETDRVSDFTIFPNPATVDVTIRSLSAANSAFNVRLLDVTGRQVMPTAISSANEAYLACSGIGKGLYLVEVTTGTAHSVYKILLQ